jgi:tricorn protease
MKKNLLILFMLLGCMTTNAQKNSEWFRYASISPDGSKIAFTYKGDIYLVNAAGGDAQAHTFHEAHDFMPVWSNDGKKIAFASDRHGNFDVFVIDIATYEEKRLSYHSNDEYPYSFSADDKYIIFGANRLDAVNHRQYPTGSQPEVYKVPADGGWVEQVWTIPAEDIQIRKDGKEFIYHDKKGGEDEFRKHHQSAVTRDIWKYDAETKKHTQITSFYGEDRNPVYAPGEKDVYYLSEKSGTFNVHKMSLANPAEDKLISNFKMHPVRYLSISNDGVLCFTHNGNLYTKTETGEPKLIDVNIKTNDKTNNIKVLPVSGGAKEMAISPDGKEVAYIVRGEVFVSSVENKMSKRITNTPEQERFVSFSPDGKSIIYASERNAKWSIYQTKKVNEKEPYFFASTVLKEEPILENENENYQPKYSPDGKEIAFIENRRELKIYTLATKQTRTMLSDKELYYMGDGDKYFEWSPDSKWLLIEYSPVMANQEVMLLAADGSKKLINLTESGYYDYSPKWVNGGKQILWFSNRNGLKSYATSGRSESDVYSFFLTKDSWDKFNLSKEDYDLLKELEKKDKKEDDKTDKKKKKDKKEEEKTDSLEVKFDWDGLKDRKKRLTIHSSRLADAVLSKDGENLYYLARFEKNLDLWSTELRTKETKKVLDLGARSASLEWDKEMKKLFLLSDGKIYTIDVEGKKKKSVAIKGEMLLDALAERQQMFDHVWRRTKSMFYTSDFHGADWDALRKNYEPKLASVGNDFEFSQLLSEMLGELNTSHTGARYRSNDPQGDKTASLGVFIDYDYTGEGLKIAEIIKEGPLDKESLKVKAGMVIQKINGVPIKRDVDYANASKPHCR